MSAYTIVNFWTTTQDGQHYNFWDASFKDMHLYVPESSRITVDSSMMANLPGIAASLLGSRYLWWAVLAFNPNVQDPLNDMVPGTVLRIPDARQLAVFIQSNASQQVSGNYLPGVSVTTL